MTLQQTTAGCGAAFSGGVDSFYTFLSLQEKLTHTLFMAVSICPRI
jgi:tRNA(Ile)-lysidine synthase TilS/MesJ